MTDSSSDVSWTGASITSTPKDGAAALNGLGQNSRNDAIAGLNKAATRVTWGAISLSNSIHLPACVGSATAKPVALLPGRGKLATKPLPIVAAVHPAQFLQLLDERSALRPSFRIALRPAHQYADPAHPLRLLRPCRERPRRRATSE